MKNEEWEKRLQAEGEMRKREKRKGEMGKGELQPAATSALRASIKPDPENEIQGE